MSILSWKGYAAVSTVFLVLSLALGCLREGGSFTVEAMLADVLHNPAKIVLAGNFIAVACGWVFFTISSVLFGTLSSDEKLLLQEKALNFVLLKLVFSAALLGVHFDVEALLWAGWVGIIIVLEQLAALARRRLDAVELHGQALTGFPPHQHAAIMSCSVLVACASIALGYLAIMFMGGAKPLVSYYLALDGAHAAAIAMHTASRGLAGGPSAPAITLALDGAVDVSTLFLSVAQDWLALQLGLMERGVGVMHLGLLWLALGRAWALLSKVGDYARHVGVMGRLKEAQRLWEAVDQNGLVCGISMVRVGPGGDAVRTSCGHVFRTDLLVRWVGIRATGAACPMCGADLIASPSAGASGGTAAGSQAAVPAASQGAGEWPDGVRMPPADSALGHADALVLRLDGQTTAGRRGDSPSLPGAGGARAAGAGAGFLGLPSLSLSVVTGGAFGLRTDLGRPLGRVDVPAVLGRGMEAAGSPSPLDRNVASVLDVAPQVREQAVRERLQGGASVGAVVEAALAGQLPAAGRDELEARPGRGAGSESKPAGKRDGASTGAGAGAAEAQKESSKGWPEDLAAARAVLEAPLPSRKGGLSPGGMEADARSQWLLQRARARFAVRRAREISSKRG